MNSQRAFKILSSFLILGLLTNQQRTIALPRRSVLTTVIEKLPQSLQDFLEKPQGKVAAAAVLLTAGALGIFGCYKTVKYLTKNDNAKVSVPESPSSTAGDGLVVPEPVPAQPNGENSSVPATGTPVLDPTQQVEQNKSVEDAKEQKAQTENTNDPSGRPNSNLPQNQQAETPSKEGSASGTSGDGSELKSVGEKIEIAPNPVKGKTQGLKDWAGSKVSGASNMVSSGLHQTADFYKNLWAKRPRMPKWLSSKQKSADEVTTTSDVPVVKTEPSNLQQSTAVSVVSTDGQPDNLVAGPETSTSVTPAAAEQPGRMRRAIKNALLWCGTKKAALFKPKDTVLPEAAGASTESIAVAAPSTAMLAQTPTAESTATISNQ